MSQAAGAGTGTTSSSTSSSAPVRKDCTVPGKGCYTLWRTDFTIDEKYVPIKAVGKGAYGVVCSAKDFVTGEKVAIKKITNAFENLTDARRILREIKLLRQLRHENIIAMRDIMRPPSRNFNDVYIVYELMDTDLHQIIRSQQPLSNEHFQYFIYQVLRGLKYMHSANVLHRDLKPSNLLLNASCDLKICDLGLARGYENDHMTEYVVTRWYRAPELLLSCETYTAAIDVWSVGCILAELLSRKPLFPGKDYVHQLSLITKLAGTPTGAETDFVTSDKARRYLATLPPCPRVELRSLWPEANAQAVDLIERMLVFDPRQRITVEQALAHPYLAPLHDPTDEPTCHAPFVFEHDAEKLSGDVIRQLALAELAQHAARGGVS